MFRDTKKTAGWQSFLIDKLDDLDSLDDLDQLEQLDGSVGLEDIFDLEGWDSGWFW